MLSHELASFAALLLSGIAGALIVEPLGKTMKLALRRVRISDRLRR